MRILTVCVLALFLTGCSLFTDDATPAIRAEKAQTQIVLDSFEFFETLIKESDMAEAEKVKVLATLQGEKNKYLALDDKMLEYLEGLGDVDWKVVAKDAYNLYKEYKAGN